MKGERDGSGSIQMLMLENDEEFRSGARPTSTVQRIKERKDEEFDLLVRRVKRLRSKVKFRERRCDYDARTSRKRLYLIAHRDRSPIAHGFPRDYTLDPIGTKGKPQSISSSIRMIGNSVCPDVAEALTNANAPLEWFMQVAA